MTTISSQAKDFTAIRKALASTPDVRADKVAPLQAMVNSNQYNVKSGDIADKILSGL